MFQEVMQTVRLVPGVWQSVLSTYYFNSSLTPAIIYGTVRYLHLPNLIKDCRTYLAVASTTFWQKWNLYWLHGTKTPSDYHPPQWRDFRLGQCVKLANCSRPQIYNQIISPVPLFKIPLR